MRAVVGCDPFHQSVSQYVPSPTISNEPVVWTPYTPPTHQHHPVHRVSEYSILNFVFFLTPVVITHNAYGMQAPFTCRTRYRTSYLSTPTAHEIKYEQFERAMGRSVYVFVLVFAQIIWLTNGKCVRQAAQPVESEQRYFADRCV